MRLTSFVDTMTAADMLGKARTTVYDMVDRGLLTQYRIGTQVLYWAPQVSEVAAALERLRVRR
jgi:excisionase family DNA binding protein